MSIATPDPSFVSRAERQPCRFCREPILMGASYCGTCEQFQTTGARWRKEFSFSALVGALPLFALVYAFVQDRTARVYSQVRALPVECGVERVVMGLTNGGNRPAVVAGGTLVRTTPSGTSPWPLTNVAENGALVVDPTRPLVVRFAVGSPALGQPPAAGPGESCRYAVALDVLEFGATTPRKESLTCSCPVG